MSRPFIPPSTPPNVAIQRMLVHRVDELRLARGMVVGTTEANERSFVSHGRRNSVCDDPVQPDTVFELGSITKLFTVLLLANMMQRGEAELNEPVAHLLPAGTRVPCRNGREITLCDLAAHRSGLPLRPTNLQPSDRDDPYARYTADQLYEFLGTHELLLTPGDVYTYSNVGTGLLGYALARRAASRDYETLLRERILAPLGMNDTVIGLPPRLAQRLASPHNSSLDATPLWNFDVLAGAGALRSTAIDMLTFLEAIADAHSPVGGMVSSVIASRDEGGMGLGAPHPDGGTTIAHAGGTGGSRSSIRYIPQWKRGVVVLSNSNVDAVIDLGVHILDTRYSPLWFRKEVPVEPSVFTRLIGSYQISPGRTLEVTNPDGRLFVRHTSEATRVFPSSEWQYFYKALNAQITFEPGSDGRAARLVLHESGSDQIAIRVA